jgi:TolA-binding protein
MPPSDSEQLLNNSRTLNFEARFTSLNFNVMKRAFASVLLGSLVLVSGAAQAADAVTLAAQQEAEERYKRMSATVEELQTALTAQQKQISSLAGEVSKLRDEIARNNNNSATQESIRELNEQIVKVDRSRIEDNKRIQEALEKLGQTIIKAPLSTPRRVDSNPTPNNPGGNPRPQPNRPAQEEGFEYVVQKDDILDKIIARYREEKIMVTRKAVMDANPTVDWNRLRIGQKIFIPKPK